jgi:CMP-N-acetylneuraminic acid synthetase
MSINIELNSKEINIEICKNILKMLERRKVINTTDEIFDKIFNDINNKASLEFLLKDKTKCSIYIVNARKYLKKPNLLTKNSTVYEMEKKHSIQIDDYFDLKLIKNFI